MPKVEAAVAVVEEYVPELIVAVADATGAYGVYKETIAAAKGKCKP